MYSCSNVFKLIRFKRTLFIFCFLLQLPIKNNLTLTPPERTPASSATDWFDHFRCRVSTGATGQRASIPHGLSLSTVVRLALLHALCSSCGGSIATTRFVQLYGVPSLPLLVCFGVDFVEIVRSTRAVTRARVSLNTVLAAAGITWFTHYNTAI